VKKLLLFLSAAFSFFLLSYNAFAAKPNLAYTSITVTFGTPFTITPTNTGGSAPVTCTTTPGLATGITIANTTGIITGTATVAVGTYTYTITATNGNGTQNPKPTVTITVVAAPTLSYASPAAFTPNTAITSFGPTSSGVATLGFNTGTALSATGLNGAYGMTTDASGSIYVTNYNGNTIRKYSSAGANMGTFGTGATFAEPAGIVFGAAVGSNGYVLNRSTNGNGNVYTVSSSGAYQSTIISGLNRAYGMAIDFSGNIYIADERAGAIYKYSNTGSLLLTITTNLNTPYGVAVDGSGNIYALDPGNGRVYKYDSSGTYVSSVVTAGISATAYGISIDPSGNIFIGDSGNNRVREYTSTGTLLTTITNNVNDPRGMVSNSSGDLFVSDFTNNTVIEYAPAGGYFLSGTLPPGLSFDSTTGTVSGTPTTTFTATTYTVTAYNTAGTAITATFTISCSLPLPNITYVNPAITPSSPPYTFYQGITITAAQSPTPLNSGGAVYTTNGYAINTPLSAGLAFSTTTGVINGTPTATSTGTYTVTGSNATGSSSYGPFTINVVLPPAPISISYTPAPDYTFIQGAAITTLVPTVNPSGTLLPSAGAYVLTLTSAPGTPITTINGLTFNTSTGQLSGTPTGTQTATNYTVTVSNAGGSASVSFNITINPKAPVITYAPNNANTWLVGTGYSISPNTTGGGAVSTWSYTGTLPPGIAFDYASGIISGTPNTPGSYSVTVTGTNVTNSSSKTVTFTVNYPNPVISYTPVNPYTSAASINLPVTNSQAAVTTGYSLTGTLPAGVTLNTSTGAISGTLPTVTGQTTYTVTVTASTGSSSGNTSVTIIVNPFPPAFTYNTPNVYKVNVAITTLSPVPTAGGGTVAAPGTFVGTTVLTSTVGNGSLNKPYGMAVDPSGNVYVVNDNGASSTVTEYSTSGTITVYSSSIPSGAVGIVFDSAGNAYVLGQTSKTVVKFTGGLSGSASTIITGLTTPTGIAYYGATNTLYIADSGTNNIKEYSTSGVAGITITPPNNLFGSGVATVSGGVAVDASGNVYVADNSFDFLAAGVDEYGPTGTFIKNQALGFAFGVNNYAGLYIDGSGNIYVTDTAGNTATVYTSGFATVIQETGFNTPDGIVADRAGNFYVSDFANNTVTKYSPTGGYYLSGTLPPGLSFSTTTGKITGTPTAAFATTTYTVTAYNAGGSGTSNTFTITCAYPPSFTYASPQTYQVGVAITTLSPVFAVPNGGGPLVSATVTTNGPLPAGLTLNADGTITGTPTAASGPTTYTITGTNAAGLTGTATVTITCAYGPVFTYSPLPVYPVGSAISPTLSPTVTAGGPITSVTISPALPASLSISASGVITGTPSAPSSATYTVTAKNSYGFTGTATVTIVCAYAPVFTYSPTPQVDTVGVVIPTTTTNVTAGSPISSYAINTPLPGGFIFDTTTGTISGTPTVTSPLTTYTVTATNALGLTGPEMVAIKAEVEFASL